MGPFAYSEMVVMSMNRKHYLKKSGTAMLLPRRPDSPAVLYIDLHLVHEVTSPQAFDGLRQRGLRVRRPERTLATMDHSTPTTTPGFTCSTMPWRGASSQQMQRTARSSACRFLDLDSPQRGIVHVIGPELGLTQPGMTIVCGDSHTSTHGAFGALAFGIGTSEVEHVLATQCLLQDQPKTCQVRFQRPLSSGCDRQGYDPGFDRTHRHRRWDWVCV